MELGMGTMLPPQPLEVCRRERETISRGSDPTMEVVTIALLTMAFVVGWSGCPGADAQAILGPDISPESKITFNQTLSSANETFYLGFRAIPTDATTNYLCVWYAGVTVHPVWIANRDRPVKEGASLELTSDGDLVLSESDGTVVWTSNTSTSGVTRATFLETGDLVLLNSSGSWVWHSYAYPTDTFLPGMTARAGTKCVSWRGWNDPATGPYALQMLTDNSGQQVLTWNLSVPYFYSGPWTGSAYENIPELGIVSYPDRYIFDNSSGSPTVSWTTGGIRSRFNNLSLKRFTVDADGVARQYIWDIDPSSWLTYFLVPKHPCQVYRVCGQNGVCNTDESSLVCSCLQAFEPTDPNQWRENQFWSQGCKRTLPLNCSDSAPDNSTTDKFVALNQISYEGDNNLHSFIGQSETWCRNRCLEDCACTGYTFQNDTTSNNCSVDSSSVLFNGQNSSSFSGSFFLRVSADFQSQAVNSPPRQMLGRRHKKSITLAAVISIGLVSGSLVLSLLLALVWWAVRRHNYAAANQKSLDYITGALIRFSYKELRVATNNFSEQLGKGGFGTVHKGVLLDNSIVAVKKLVRLKQGEKEFRTEVAVIGTVQHINLVRLRGFCTDGVHRALVFDYMPKGSLEKYLFTKKAGTEGPQKFLDWKTRFNIALGTARGIAYLHEECRISILHCDIKPENILLEEDFTAKVADFGLARFMGEDVSRVITNIRGTIGYLAPEWLSSATLTSKADVYSYGMTLLELISGRRTIELSLPSDKWFVAVWAFHQMTNGDFRSLTDENLHIEDVDQEQLERAVRVALWCVQEQPDQRPTMGSVVKMLEGNVVVSDPPVPVSLEEAEGERRYQDFSELMTSRTQSRGSSL